MGQRVVVAGASGFIGSHLGKALVAQRHEVRAMTRRPRDYDGAGTPVFGDVADPGSLAAPMRGADAAYYLVHSLASADFEGKDAEAARHFGAAAAAAGVKQIIYLGGLGRDGDDLSPHLRSRHEVEHLLARAGVPVTTLRAAVVVGHGGISWEITRRIVDRLPAMITPTWVDTRTQPIALVDAIRYLVGVLGEPRALGRTFEVGGPDVLRYIDMLQRAAAVLGKSLPRVRVPLLPPRSVSPWLAFVTGIDTATVRNLVGSMTNEVVVHDHAIEEIVPGPRLTYEESVRRALADRRTALAAPARRALTICRPCPA